MALIVGIDLGRKSPHDAVTLRHETGLPTGRAFRVYRPSAYRVKKIRQASHRRKKTNRIDPLTLARCLKDYPQDTALVFLPQGDQARLDRIVRQRDRVVDSLARCEQRIQDLCEAVNPGLTRIPDGFLLNEAGRAFLRAYLDPRTVLRLGKKRQGFGGFYPSVRKTGDRASSRMPISKMSCNRRKRYLYLAAGNAYKWDPEMAAFYHKGRRAGHTHTQAVSAVANAKLLRRIHQLMERLREAERNKTTRPRYVFRDLSGNPISEKEAKAIITAAWGNVDCSKKGVAMAWRMLGGLVCMEIRSGAPTSS